MDLAMAMYEWRDPAKDAADAKWLRITKEALRIERRAWEISHAERVRLWRKIHRIKGALGAYERGKGPGGGADRSK